MFWMHFALAGPPLTCGMGGPVSAPPRPLVPRAAGDRIVRDAFSPNLNIRETEHFAIKWGTYGTPQTPHLDRLEADLEWVWEHQIERLDWLPPTGSEVYKLNVYLGYDGDEAPTIDFDGGYVWSDEEGYPYIVISPGSLGWYEVPGDDGETVRGLLAHEFFHTLQARDWTRYSDLDTSFFWWEATASWTVPYLFEDPDLARFGGFLVNPHMSLATWSQEWDEPEAGGRQYETAAFAYWLSETYGTDVVKRSWEQAGDAVSLIEFLDRELPDGAAAAFTDFAIAMATEDHERAEAWSEEAAVIASSEGQDDQVAYQVRRAGTDGWVRVDPRRRPRSFSWNRIDWVGGAPGNLVVGFRSANPQLRAYAVTLGETPYAEEIEGAEVFEVDQRDLVRLVVVSTDDEIVPDAQYGYEFNFAFAEQPIPERPESDGFACSSSGGSWMSTAGSWFRR